MDGRFRFVFETGFMFVFGAGCVSKVFIKFLVVSVGIYQISGGFSRYLSNFWWFQ